MKVAVCVKHVPTGSVHIDPASMLLDRSGPCELNDFDKNAIEEAVQIKGRVDGEVVVISMGPEAATESLRTALALGADRAVLVSDPAMSGSDLVATSKVLAKAIEREQADLVLFGQQTSDGGGAMLWAAIAERLLVPFVSQAAELSMPDAGIVRVARETEAGNEVVDVRLPALVAVSDAINEPRYTSLKGVMGAKKKPLEVLTLADLGLDAADVGAVGSKTEVLGLGDPPARANSVKIEDDGTAAQRILDYLVEKQLV